MIEFLIPTVIILLLVLANGLFVAAEFAIVGASRTTIDHQAAHGERLAQRVAAILADPKEQDRYIATTQIGISIASLELVTDVAEELGEHVLERQQTGGAAEFVDDQRLVRSPFPQQPQHAVSGHAFVHAGDRTHQVRQRRVRVATDQ